MERGKFTGRFLALASLAYMLIFVGFITVNGAPIALSIPLVVYLVAALYSPAPRLQMSAKRVLSDETLIENSVVTVKSSDN